MNRFRSPHYRLISIDYIYIYTRQKDEKKTRKLRSGSPARVDACVTLLDATRRDTCCTGTLLPLHLPLGIETCIAVIAGAESSGSKLFDRVIWTVIYIYIHTQTVERRGFRNVLYK